MYPRPARISGASHLGLVAAMLLSTALSSITLDRLKSHTCTHALSLRPTSRHPLQCFTQDCGLSAPHCSSKHFSAAPRDNARRCTNHPADAVDKPAMTAMATQGLCAYLDSPVLVHKEVWGLEIAVNDRWVGGVKVVHPLCSIQRHAQPAAASLMLGGCPLQKVEGEISLQAVKHLCPKS